MPTLGEIAGRPDRIAQMVEGIRQNTHLKALVIGYRSSNFPEPYQRHPQLLFWEADRADAGSIPVAVRLVLMTRFVDHKLYRRVHEECAKRNIIAGPKLYGTGEVKAILGPLISKVSGAAVRDAEPEVAKPVSVPTAAPKKAEPRRFARGELRAFVLAHGDIDKQPYADEANRLADLAIAQGFAASAESVKQSMYVLRQEQIERNRTAATFRAAVHPEQKEASVPEAVRPAPPVTIVPAPATASATLDGLTDDDAELLRLLDDAVAALGLVRQEITKRSDRRRQLRQLLKDI